jgi:hypothetical protein
MPGIYPESLKQCFPVFCEIPDEFRLASQIDQRASCRRRFDHV